MEILIRLALSTGLLCMLWHAAFPGIPLPIPGFGNPFLELAFLVLGAVVVHEFWSCWNDARHRGDSPDEE